MTTSPEGAIQPWTSGPRAPLSEGKTRQRSLASDPFVRLAVVLFLLLSLPFFLPFLDEDQLWYFGGFLLDAPLVLLVEIAFIINFFETKGHSARLFWGWMIFGFFFWSVQTTIGIVFEWTTALDMVSHFAFFSFYAAVVMALESRPHLRPDRQHRFLLAFERVGALVFLLGALFYLSLFPGLVDWESYWSSSLFLFVIIDLFIILRLLAFLRSPMDRAWRSTYLWLLVAAGMWFLADAAEALMWVDLIPYIESGTPWDILWILNLLPLAAVARVGRYEPAAPDDRATGSIASEWEAFGMGPIVVYAVMTPLFHLLFYRFGWADPVLMPIRELVAVVFASILASMAFVHQLWMRRENKQLALQRSEVQAQLEHQAYHDGLTGLPNRRLFHEHLGLAMAQAQRRKNHCAIFFCDLDRFKVVNDSLGHDAGDRVLLATAQRLRESIRESDSVARLGGDEFAVLVHDIEDELSVVPVAQHLLNTLREPIDLDGGQHVFTSSIGIAIFPEDGREKVSLLKNADLAMYQAKVKGRNIYQLFTPAMNQAAEERLLIEQGLRAALADGDFQILYQPIIDLASRKLVGCEALLRWHHPQRGLLGPDLFIQIAEQTGLIVPIGEWVLETSCAWAQSLLSPNSRNLSVAVNISPRQLQQADFPERVASILQQTGLEPSRLQLEITESMAFEGKDTEIVIAKLRALGLRIAIDDLGTGFSGLSRLRDLPIDVVKIDRSFIGKAHIDAAGEAIVQAIVSMARALELQVVAEGVETEKQLDVVERQGCHSAQGFHFHRPVSPSAIENLLDEVKVY